MANKSVLQNIRILDFSWVLAGPYATRMLTDFGAEVIKIQPLMTEAEDSYSRGYYNTWNRNKMGITLNMGKPAGIEIARKLVKISDIVVENFSPRVMMNWGLDYPTLKMLKPDIISISMSVMGHSGPWKDYSGFGPTVQAFSGITGLTAYPDQAPLGLGYSYADHIAGLYAGLAILGALEYRRRTGEGQYIDLSQTETMTSLMSDTVQRYTYQGQEIQPVGNSSTQCAPQGVYRCQGDDRWCAISVENDEEWAGFRKAIGNPAWVNDERFKRQSDRSNNREALDNFIQEWTQNHTAEEVMIEMQKAGVPAGIVQNASDLAHDPQLRERGFFFELEHPEMGKIISDASPIRLSETPPTYHRAAPVHGQDNDYVYRQLLKLSESEIELLKQEKII